jgi:hypothetical protein
MRVADRLEIFRFALKRKKCAVLGIESIEPARCAHPKPFVAILVNGCNIAASYFFGIKRSIGVMLKCIAGAIQHIQSTLRSDPQIVRSVEIQNIHIVIAQTGGILLVVQITLECLIARIITVQTAQACSDPQVAILVFDDGCDPAVA